MGGIRSAILLAALVLLTFSSTPQAASNTGTSSPHTADAVENIVAKQLTAFKARNSADAYAVVSETFRKKYKSPLSFATMMRINFWELYNHASYRFIGKSHLGDSEIQKVEVTGEDDIPYIYLFRLTRAFSGEWQIDSVIMLDPEAQPI